MLFVVVRCVCYYLVLVVIVDVCKCCGLSCLLCVLFACLLLFVVVVVHD